MSASLNVCDGRVGSGEECWEQLCPVGRLVGGTCEAVHVLGEGRVYKREDKDSLSFTISQSWAWA